MLELCQLRNGQPNRLQSAVAVNSEALLPLTEPALRSVRLMGEGIEFGGSEVVNGL